MKVFDGDVIRSSMSDFKSIEDQEYSVYILLDEDEIVYVGKSTNVINRIKAHKSDKNFSYYYIQSCKDNIESSLLEREYILKFRPKYNENLPLMKRVSNAIKKALAQRIDKDELYPDLVDRNLITTIAHKSNVNIYNIKDEKYIKLEDYSKFVMYVRLYIE